jgi:hypothetical protein
MSSPRGRCMSLLAHLSAIFARAALKAYLGGLVIFTELPRAKVFSETRIHSSETLCDRTGAMRLFVPVRYPRSRHVDTPSHKNSLAPTESPSLGSTSKTCSRSSAIDCCHGFGQPLLRARAFLALHLSGHGRMPYRTGG